MKKKKKEMWNVDIRLNEINCSSFLELFTHTHTDAQTNTHTALGLAILNCFWSSTSYAHTFSSEKMVLTYKDYKMACQTMANSKSSSWSFHLLNIIFISFSRIEIQNAKSMHKIKIFLFLFIHKEMPANDFRFINLIILNIKIL